MQVYENKISKVVKYYNVQKKKKKSKKPFGT
jgi:hypothetical protein